MNYQLAPPPFDEDDLRFWFFDDLLLPATKEAVDVLLLRVLCGLKSGLVDQLAPPPLPDDDAEEGERMLVLVCLFDELAVDAADLLDQPALLAGRQHGLGHVHNQRIAAGRRRSGHIVV